MKKLILALAICIIPAKVMSANFVDTLGSECARILFNIESKKYPSYYPQLKNRNSQFYALEQCLKVYKQVGGDFEKFNKKYDLARELAMYDWSLCELNKKDGDKDCEVKDYLFQNAISNLFCATFKLVESEYPNFNYKNVLEIICTQETEEILKNQNLNNNPWNLFFSAYINTDNTLSHLLSNQAV